MLARIKTATHIGFNSHVVDVECDSTNSLPGISVVGLPAKSVDEAKDRIRSAIRHSQLELPPKRYTLNLAPADLPKQGTGFDLPMAVALLACTGQIDNSMLSDSYFMGELSLDGSLRPIHGTLARAMAVAKNPHAQLFVSPANAAEAALVKSLKIFPANSLAEVYKHLIGEAPLPLYRPRPLKGRATTDLDFEDISGQEHAKRALMISAAGGHNILMNGPPGSGKTMLSKALVSILPPLTPEEITEVTLVHSIAGENKYEVVAERPFRSPHHTASTISLVGGGRHPTPGEISLSHRGVLFLDELPEYSKDALEALRQPLEDKRITVARTESRSTFPADFILVGTQNPCPCGYASDPKHPCICSAAEINRYMRKISGPLLDRIDITLEVSRINNQKLLSSEKSQLNSKYMLDRVLRARETQRSRNPKQKLNGNLSSSQIKNLAGLSPESHKFLDESAEKLLLSARAIMKTLKVSRTIADLEEKKQISISHLAEALQYRKRPVTL